jgi:hypothetical protein
VTGRWDRATHQGLYAEGLVSTLALAAGLNLARYDWDPGMDRIISTPGPRGARRSPMIQVQIKSWSSPKGTGTYWSFPLKIKAYNDLAEQGVDEVRRYLVLCIVPDDVRHFVRAGHDDLRFQRAAYWHYLGDERRLDDSLGHNSTKTVHVPKVQLLTPATLVALVEGREQEAMFL